MRSAVKNLRPLPQKGLAFARERRFHGAALGLRASLMFRRRHEERTMTGLAAERAEGGFQRGKIFVAIELSKAKWDGFGLIVSTKEEDSDADRT
jgi:hypothetical protein